MRLAQRPGQTRPVRGGAAARYRIACLALWLGLCALPASLAAENRPPVYWDPLAGTVERMDGFLQRYEVDGVTRDYRSLNNAPEEIRLSVVPQLLGYSELYRLFGKPEHFDDVTSRAEFLLDHFGEITSGTAFDGMLGYALLIAYELTGNHDYLFHAMQILDLCLDLGGSANTLNWGLMCGMCLAQHYSQTGEPNVYEKTRQIIDTLLPLQNPDGSFPHFCPGSTDIHYTAWMAMELILIRELLSYELIDALLVGNHRFLAGRIDANGESIYEEECPNPTPEECWLYYYGQQSGCPQDYDTRGWNNELGYHALVFDVFDDSTYEDVLGFLVAQEDGGAYPDKWGYMPDPEDPIYIWASATRSVIRTSVIFWALAYTLRQRHAGAPIGLADAAVGPVDPPWTAVTVDSASAQADTAMITAGSVAASAPLAAPAAGVVRASPNPFSRSTTIAFEIAEPSPVFLRIYDARGRLVRELERSQLAAGRHQQHWDGRTDQGSAAASGVYFYRLELPGYSTTGKLVRMH
jgi:hypothetical protein